MSVPPALVGAWRRVGLHVDGLRRVDTLDVLWLQAEEWYADIRLPIVAPGPADPEPGAFLAPWAFAGRARFEDPVMTWERAFDSVETGAVDAGRLEWADGVMVERGEAPGPDGTPVTYVEDWLRMTDEEPVVTHADRCVRVSVGRWGIEVADARPDGPFVATRFDVGAHGWAPVAEVRVAPGATAPTTRRLG